MGRWEKLFAAKLHRRKGAFMTPLRRRMTEDMQVRNLSSHTQATYVQQVFLFARHFNKSPEIFGPEEIRSYQIYLMNERKLAPSSISIAVINCNRHSQCQSNRYLKAWLDPTLCLRITGNTNGCYHPTIT